MAGYGRGGFGGFGGGNQMQQLMKQAQKMQEEMQKAQEELEEAEIEGSSGGGVVTVSVNDKKVLNSIHIDPKAVDPDDIETLQDLVVAAVNEALSTANAEYEQAMGKVTGGMNLGGMF